MAKPEHSGPIELNDRLATRARPEGWPLMYQSWLNLLFMHWRLPVEQVRPLIPKPIEIDTFDGSAWVAVTPFELSNVRPIFVPPIPFVSEFCEINVRTYVYYKNVPGVWFFSLDANSMLAVMGARLAYRLPYHNAEQSLNKNGDSIHFRSKRSDSDAEFEAKWMIKDGEAKISEPGSLEFFLTERYCLYTTYGRDLYRCRIHHEPWRLGPARIENYSTDLFAANALSVPEGEPILHAARPVDVEVWPLAKISSAVQ